MSTKSRNVHRKEGVKGQEGNPHSLIKNFLLSSAMMLFGSMAMPAHTSYAQGDSCPEGKYDLPYCELDCNCANASDICLAEEGTCIPARASCLEILQAGESVGSGEYWIDPDVATEVDGVNDVQPVKVYCDMVTDGGGWTLITIGNDSDLLTTASSSYLANTLKAEDGSAAISGRIPNDAIAAMFERGDQQVMAAEISGTDSKNGLVMVYKLASDKPLEFGNTNNNSAATVEWHTGGGNYTTVTNNVAGSANWIGVSAHSTAFGSIASSDRCTYRADFDYTGGTNGDYKQEHTGTHGGTTRCLHSSTSIGVSHWIREADTCAPGEFGLSCTPCNCADGLVCQDGKYGAGTCSTPHASCAAVLANDSSAKDGVYWIDPDGTGANNQPFQVYCDMTTAGGGWTMVMNKRETFTNTAGWTRHEPSATFVTPGHLLNAHSAPPENYSILGGAVASASDVMIINRAVNEEYKAGLYRNGLPMAATWYNAAADNGYFCGAAGGHSTPDSSCHNGNSSPKGAYLTIQNGLDIANDTTYLLCGTSDTRTFGFAGDGATSQYKVYSNFFKTAQNTCYKDYDGKNGWHQVYVR